MLQQIPNALTLLRGLVMTPAIVALFIWYIAGNFGLVVPPDEYFPFRSVALLLAALCVGSDALDGHLARAYGWRTDFGARVDPLMDKFFSYACLAVVPLYFGLGWYLIWYIAFAWKVDEYSRATTAMRTRGESLDANQAAKYKTAYLFAAQLAFFAAIAAEDVLSGGALWYFVTFAFWVAFGTMLCSVLYCGEALALYRRQAAMAHAARSARPGKVAFLQLAR